MYSLSDQQIEFISGDISARGIGMVSLQQDLLDHICCVIEHGLEENGNFERFYCETIATFYKSDLKEIEAETVYLLTNKNYYTMKKVMITGGALSVAILSAGIILKFLHMPGAAVLIVSGIFILSFVFLPLMFALRIKEKQQNADRAISVIGAVCAMGISLGILFKLMHWPGANIMCSLALLMMIFGFIPVYFFSGIRHPATKVNTIVSSIMMFTGCILILTLVRAPATSRMENIANTNAYLQSDQIVKNEKRQVEALGKADPQSERIFRLCEELKSFLVERETGGKKIDADFESKDAFIGETWANDYLSGASEETKKLDTLKVLVAHYNKLEGKTTRLLPAVTFQDNRVQQMLNSLMQVQMAVLQNRREMVAMD